MSIWLIKIQEQNKNYDKAYQHWYSRNPPALVYQGPSQLSTSAPLSNYFNMFWEILCYTVSGRAWFGGLPCVWDSESVCERKRDISMMINIILQIKRIKEEWVSNFLTLFPICSMLSCSHVALYLSGYNMSTANLALLFTARQWIIVIHLNCSNEFLPRPETSHRAPSFLIHN